MIEEVEPTSKIVGLIRDLARKIIGRNETPKAKRNLLDPLMMRLSRRKAV
jgi:hypothetical protein